MRKSNNIFVLILLTISILITVGCSREIKPAASGDNIKEQETPAQSVEIFKIETPKAESKEEVEQKEEKAVREIEGLVKVQDLDSSIVIDLKYTDKDNFTGKKIYPVNVCVLRKETAEKLVKANEEFKKNGYRIKIWDAYRPPYVQQIFWDLVKDSRFVANPKNGGSRHNIGTAVDITLIDNSGKELVMPTKFDDFTVKAYRDNSNMSKEVRKNVDLLTEVMKKSGFIPLKTEWWHFDDSDSGKYKVIDVKLEKFIN